MSKYSKQGVDMRNENKPLEFTGERMVPNHNKDQSIYAEHIVRYMFAVQFIRGKEILDIACGSGYGSALLADAGAKKVTGVDISEAAIDHAVQNYSRENIEFLVGDAAKIPLKDNSMDVVVSFETIEHIPDYKSFLAEVRRVLKPNGIFLVSTPNKKIYPAGNEYHIKEFYVDEFETLLGRHFPKIILEKQKTLNLECLFADEVSLKNSRLTVASDLNSIEPMYVLAICGENLKALKYEGINFLNQGGENELNQHLKYLQKVVGVRDEQLLQYKAVQEKLEMSHKYKDKVIEIRDEELSKYKEFQKNLEISHEYKDKVIEKRDEQLLHYKAAQEELEVSHKYKDKVIETRDQQLSQYEEYQLLLKGDILHQKNLRNKEALEKWEIEEFPFYEIIVPVYNGYDFVKDCIDSLLKTTNYPFYRVIVINDAGECEKTKTYLQEISQNEKVVLLKNKKNLGFVGTVNRGMQYSENEVILLNSDTVLTKNWLLKMHQARMKNPGVASVTPLTNNGTICSVPNWLQDNKLPQNLSLEAYGNLVEKISLKEYPILPTAVGFCMLITRESLNEVGWFDEKSFGKGYGEENDWCVRALKLGYKNILDDQTFVQHKGSMTFGDSPEKQKKLEENLKILNQKHPEYLPWVESFIQQNPMLDIIQNIQLNLEFNNGKKNILYILHNDIGNAIGGTELHVADLVHHFRHSHNIFVFFPQKNKICIRHFSQKKHRDYCFDLFAASDLDPFSNQEIEKILQQAIAYFSIDLVHFHHLMNLPLSLIEVAHKSRAKVIFSLHDYFFHCPCPQLLTPDWSFCNFSESKKDCEACLPHNAFIKAPFKNFDFLKRRRLFVKRSLLKVEKIVTPSRFIAQKAQSILDLPGQNMETVYHGICHQINKKILKSQTKTLNVAILGAFTKIKGADLFSGLVIRMKKNKKIKFKIIGKNGDPAVFNTIKKHVIHREYTRENLGEILETEKIDLILLPSIWAETFCYTLSEALAHGIPVVTTKLGAQGERLESLEGGWVFSVLEFVDKTEALLLDLQKNRKILSHQAKKIKTIKCQTEMFEKYTKMYKEVMSHKKTEYLQVNAKLFLDAARNNQTFIEPVTGLMWKDRVYWFLVKIKMINLIRPLYYKIFKS